MLTTALVFAALFTTGSMLAAAAVLVSSDVNKLRAGVVQGLFPALSLVCLMLAY